MTTWPVNWIEQDQVYKELLDTYEEKLAQATPVLIPSFAEPTQEEWEDAYVRQVGRIPPILPGKLRWLDLRNGTVKSYSTIYKDGGVDVDPVVRPVTGRSQEWGCIRLLGTTTAINGLGWPLERTTWINKGLIMVIVMGPGSTGGLDSIRLGNSLYGSYVSSKVGAGAASNAAGTTGGGYINPLLYLFNPATERIEDELVHRNSFIPTLAESVNNNTLSLALSGQYGTILLGGGTLPQAQEDVAGLLNNDVYKVYGIFQSDPGYIEEFEIV